MIGTVFIIVKRDHEFLISQGRNKSNMSRDSINFGPYNTNKNCSNFVEVAPANTSNTSYHVWKHGGDAEFLGRVKTCSPCSERQVRGIHFQHECTSNVDNKFQNKTSIQQMQKHNYANKFDNNKKRSKNMFPVGTLSFQVLQPIRSGKNMSWSIITIKCFLGKLGEKYSFKKKLESQHDSTPLVEESVNEIVQAVMALENDPLTQDLAYSAAGEDGLMELFDQFTGWMSLMLDGLESDTVVISKAFLQGKRATYQVTVENVISSALLDTVISKKFFRSLPQTPQLLKVFLHKVPSAIGANLDPIGQCDLTFRFGNKQFMGRFIILQELHRNIILELNCQCNYRIGCNWNINGQQYITHNNKFFMHKCSIFQY